MYTQYKNLEQLNALLEVEQRRATLYELREELCVGLEHLHDVASFGNQLGGDEGSSYIYKYSFSRNQTSYLSSKHERDGDMEQAKGILCNDLTRKFKKREEEYEKIEDGTFDTLAITVVRMDTELAHGVKYEEAGGVKYIMMADYYVTGISSQTNCVFNALSFCERVCHDSKMSHVRGLRSQDCKGMVRNRRSHSMDTKCGSSSLHDLEKTDYGSDAVFQTFANSKKCDVHVFSEGGNYVKSFFRSINRDYKGKKLQGQFDVHRPDVYILRHGGHCEAMVPKIWHAASFPRIMRRAPDGTILPPPADAVTMRERIKSATESKLNVLPQTKMTDNAMFVGQILKPIWEAAKQKLVADKLSFRTASALQDVERNKHKLQADRSRGMLRYIAALGIRISKDVKEKICDPDTPLDEAVKAMSCTGVRHASSRSLPAHDSQPFM